MPGRGREGFVADRVGVLVGGNFEFCGVGNDLQANRVIGGFDKLGDAIWDREGVAHGNAAQHLALRGRGEAGVDKVVNRFKSAVWHRYTSVVRLRAGAYHQASPLTTDELPCAQDGTRFRFLTGCRFCTGAAC